ncbi:MAG: TIGR00730 family Rossman fold protein [Bacteroidales bacterium]|nr:TIGR00730 family Rossman fold protein [Bacteroidales bacterium]
MIIKNICVFCSSSNHVAEHFFHDAANLGRYIASKGWSLVYGGTNIGLMGHIADSVLKENSHVIGVIPRHIQSKGIEHRQCTELILTDDMSERKMTMIARSDAFVALPGGFGTLEEIMEVITLKQLHLHDKPIIFLNTRNFYDHLQRFFDHIFSGNFTANKFRELYYIAPDVDSLAGYLENYQRPKLTDKWSD